MGKIGILVIHGIGQQTPEFANDFIDEMNGRLGPLANQIEWMPAYWADILNLSENALWNVEAKGGKLDYTWIRKYIINFFGDAIAYQRVPSHIPDIYMLIHRRIADRLNELRLKLGEQDAPLIILAHSLGGYIISNYIYDMQKNISPTTGMATTPFARTETLSSIVTFGCNIPLFTLAYNPIQPIQFPVPGFQKYFADSEGARNEATWLNFYDADDVLGYPLRPIYKSIGVIEDYEINVGSILTSWNPLCHSAYWTDNNFTKPVTNLIRSLLAYC